MKRGGTFGGVGASVTKKSKQGAKIDDQETNINETTKILPNPSNPPNSNSNDSIINVTSQATAPTATPGGSPESASSEEDANNNVSGSNLVMSPTYGRKRGPPLKFEEAKYLFSLLNEAEYYNPQNRKRKQIVLKDTVDKLNEKFGHNRTEGSVRNYLHKAAEFHFQWTNGDLSVKSPQKSQWTNLLVPISQLMNSRIEKSKIKPIIQSSSASSTSSSSSQNRTAAAATNIDDVFNSGEIPVVIQNKIGPIPIKSTETYNVANNSMVVAELRSQMESLIKGMDSLKNVMEKIFQQNQNQNQVVLNANDENKDTDKSNDSQKK